MNLDSLAHLEVGERDVRMSCIDKLCWFMAQHAAFQPLCHKFHGKVSAWR